MCVNVHFQAENMIFDRMTAVRLDYHPEIALWKKFDLENASKILAKREEGYKKNKSIFSV